MLEAGIGNGGKDWVMAKHYGYSDGFSSRNGKYSLLSKGLEPPPNITLYTFGTLNMIGLVLVLCPRLCVKIISEF